MHRTLTLSLLGLFSLSVVGACDSPSTPPPSASPAVTTPTVDAPQGGKGGRFGKPAIKTGTADKKTTEP